MGRPIINVKDGVVRMPEWRMAEPVNFTLNDGEQIAIVGPNGGGKTMLVNILTGSHPLLMHDPEYDFSPSTNKSLSDNIKYITFRDAYGGDNDRAYYLQQRWNQTEINENTPTVSDKLDAAYKRAGEDNAARQALKEELYDLRFAQATGSLENPARIKDIKKTIARMKTVITERANAQ